MKIGDKEEARGCTGHKTIRRVVGVPGMPCRFICKATLTEDEGAALMVKVGELRSTKEILGLRG